MKAIPTKNGISLHGLHLFTKQEALLQRVKDIHLESRCVGLNPNFTIYLLYELLNFPAPPFPPR